MVTLDIRTVTMPVGIVRILEIVLSCVCFSLVASVGHFNSSYWAWCMFTWCFCCFMTLFILILEFTNLSAKVPISWDDFTTAFAMLATLMVLAASVIYPTFFVCSSCSRHIAASVISCICFITYAVEVGLNRAKSGEISGFLSTIPGLMKVLEAFIACIIFICLDPGRYKLFAGLQWCVAVYSICFIFAILIIILTICRQLALCPFPFDKVLTGYNVLAVMILVASVGHSISSYWAWCMFTWCFCCFMTLFILILEFTNLSDKVPISWDDFTTAFAMLATLMVSSSSPRELGN
ncbi:hypothetical protein P4O66_000673 [Electrophorus voltai]|uniref:MARVEL domain-containing protein n=1 Tax=Electrophorus voltai TaxID=2609070 RepID=A0AAD8ZF02_9TELE|nr:hypothetical protein P4O66_000673 [Electrophorus voltai]